MNTRVHVAHRKDVALVEIADYPGAPPQTFARLAMAMVPPLDDGSEPGYCCVVGEAYDDDPRQKPRPKVVLDEGQALVPEDWPAPEKFGDVFWSSVEADGKSRQVRNCDRPTLTDLRHAAIALKDLYHIETAYLPAAPGTEYNPDPFLTYLLQTNGLVSYSDEFDALTYKEWYPSFRKTDATLGLVNNPPMAQDEDVNKQLVEDLLARDELQVNATCNLFQQANLVNPVRAVGLLCAVYQSHDYTFYELRDAEYSDGYETIEEAEERGRGNLSKMHDREKTRRWQAGL